MKPLKQLLYPWSESFDSWWILVANAFLTWNRILTGFCGRRVYVRNPHPVVNTRDIYRSMVPHHFSFYGLQLALHDYFETVLAMFAWMEPSLLQASRTVRS